MPSVQIKGSSALIKRGPAHLTILHVEPSEEIKSPNTARNLLVLPVPWSTWIIRSAVMEVPGSHVLQGFPESR